MTRGAHLRVARPTGDLERVAEMYREGLAERGVVGLSSRPNDTHRGSSPSARGRPA